MAHDERRVVRGARHFNTEDLRGKDKSGESAASGIK